MTAAMQIDPADFEAVLSGLHERLAEAGRRYQLKLHEAEALAVERDRFRSEAQPQKIWPVQVRCDRKRCESVVAFDPAPDEADLAQALVALRWVGHVCPVCQRKP